MTQQTKQPVQAREIDTLSLLAHKIAPNVFDLSSKQVNVSIRDQMVRAQQLVIDLKEAHEGPASILIVGMGAAGMTAALTACDLEFETVCAVDCKDQPFALFRGITSRFVGPYMYEWPSPFYDNQSYPAHASTPWEAHKKSSLKWTAGKPISANDLAAELTKGVEKWSEKRNAGEAKPASALHLVVKIGKKAIKGFVMDFAAVAAQRADVKNKAQPEKLGFRKCAQTGRAWRGIPTSLPPASFAPDYVILAAGMGIETLYIPGVYEKNMSPGFWADDKLKTDDIPKQSIAVLGGGDGAIQDTLRALTSYHHPLDFIAELEKFPAARRALAAELPALLSADRQLRQHTSWSRDNAGYIMADRACRKAAKTLAGKPSIKKFVLSALKPGTGTVSHYVRNTHFDKAYLLNRFMIFLLAACVSPDPKKNGVRMGLLLELGVEVKGARPVGPPGNRKAQWRIALGPPGDETISIPPHVVDHVVVRFGIDPDTVPGPTLLEFDPQFARDRTTLNRVELPFVTMSQ